MVLNASKKNLKIFYFFGISTGTKSEFKKKKLKKKKMAPVLRPKKK